MISKNMIKTLEIISKKLKGQNIKWVLVGSTSLALQKVRVKTKDIDILTDKSGAYRINKILKEYSVKPVKFRVSEIFQSYFGEFKIKNIKVEVMGDMKEKLRGKWVSTSEWLKSPQIIKIGKVKLPVSNLSDELRDYKELGRKKDSIKIRKIEEVLKSQARKV
jgi:hypothetical protein